jgi:prepilin-type N-terminal cleavage/methylation domain-containing protein
MTRKLFFSRFSSSKGFTLIELLVVLGILGILAAALLAAINPIEQLRKGQDTSLKNIATEFVDSNTSYFSVQNAFPWPTCYAGAMDGGVAMSSLGNCLQALVTSGELKQSFTNTPNSTLQQIIVTYPDPLNANNNGVVACFQPQSNSQQLDPNTKYTQTGASGGNGCKSQGGNTSCYWCSR